MVPRVRISANIADVSSIVRNRPAHRAAAIMLLESFSDEVLKQLKLCTASKFHRLPVCENLQTGSH
jgi:hypothetical protein